MNQTNNTVLTILVASVVVGAVTGVASAHEGIPEVVKIGGVFDVSGEWSLDGEEAKSAAELAIKDFNKYLVAIGAGWSMTMQVEDAQANQSVAFDKIQSLRGAGIDLMLGMGYSSHIQTAKSYIDSHNILAISHASQAANLAINDTIFRLRPDDNNQAPVVNAMLKHAGIEVLATVTRADPWGEGLKKGITQTFEGKIVDLFQYDPNAFDFSVSASILDEEIGDLIEEHGADKVGVLYVGTNEFLLLIQQMSPYENVSKVRWFSTTTQAANSILVDDPQALEFSEATRFTAARSITAENTLQQYVNDWVYEKYNRTASTFTYPSYDSVWLLGLSIQQAQTTDVDVLRETVPLVASHTFGSIGSMELNDAGDLIGATYEIWQVADGGWIKTNDYDPITQSIIP